MQFDSAQNRAITHACTAPLSIVTGGAGSGKTTIIKAITERLEAAGESVLLCAFAGKAAARVKAEAEAKAKAERAPDKDKLKRFVQIFDALTIPAMTTESGKIVAGNIRDRLGDFEEWLRKQVETL